ncbi:MAG: hypothetical protein KTR32_17785 [Granulosicoccus sp.]|nr:hypothetical protein [Granulosicoccus sp.]
MYANKNQTQLTRLIFRYGASAIFLLFFSVSASVVQAQERAQERAQDQTPDQDDVRILYKRIAPQFIAALGDPKANSGTGAETWGVWPVDPGPRGVWLKLYPVLKATGGFAPAGWRFDENDWWLDENGLIMDKPEFPLAAGKYMVTGEREVTTVLTIHPADESGKQRWELAENASLYDVTHLACRSARYTHASDANACTPANADRSVFKIPPDTEMPAIKGCNKQDYSVLIIVGVPADS